MCQHQADGNSRLPSKITANGSVPVQVDIGLKVAGHFRPLWFGRNGLNVRFLGGDGVCTAEMIRIGGPALSRDVYCTQAGLAMDRMPGGKDFNARFKKRFNVDVQLYAPYSYDAATALIEAMKLANSADPAKYLPLMQKVSFKGVTGPIAFDARGDSREGGVSLYQFNAGRWESRN